MVRTAETTISAALAAAVLTLAAVSGAAALEQCSLCRRSSDRNCLPGGVKESSRLKSVDPRGSGSAFVVSLSIGNNFGGIERPREDVDVMWGTNPAASVETKNFFGSGKNETYGDCFFELARPETGKGGERTVNITTTGERIPGTCWYAKKSINFDSNHQIFLNYAGSCDPASDLLGPYSASFKGGGGEGGEGERARFFVSSSAPQVSPREVVREQCEEDDEKEDCGLRFGLLQGSSNSSSDSLAFDRCLSQVEGAKVRLVRCDGNKTDVQDVETVLDEDRSLSGVDLPANCSRSFVLSCLDPGVSREVAKVLFKVSEGEERGAGEDKPPPISSSSGPWSAVALALSVLAALAAVATAVGMVCKKRKTEYSLANRNAEDESNLPSLDGPRIKLPHPQPVASVKRSHSHSSEGGGAGKQSGGIRPRLASVLSATLSFFTSSSSAGSSSSSSSGFEEGAEEGTELQPLPLGCRQWMRDRLFAMELLDIQKELGRGHYGVVFRAHVVDGAARWPVALKCAKAPEMEAGDAQGYSDGGGGALLSPQEELVKEGEVMATLPYHENIANLQGVALDTSGPDPRFFLMIEYCGNGSLHRYLLANRATFREELRRCQYEYGGRDSSGADCARGVGLLVTWGHQIARGMEYLSSRSVVHGDLATRNVLLTDDLNAKISDFGLSHRLDRRERSAALRQTHLPERWMAPEAIVERRVTAECDAWSFGILLWELFSLGEVPYKDLLVDSSAAFLGALHSGVRPSCPSGCPAEVHEVMTSCWALDPEDRASFEELAARLGGFLDEGYTHRYQEARDEMLRRYSRIQQNRLYFNLNSARAIREEEEEESGDRTKGRLRQRQQQQDNGYCVMMASTQSSSGRNTADTVVTTVTLEAAGATRSEGFAAGYCVMEGVS